MLVLSGRELNLNLEMKAKKYDMNKRHPSNFGRNYFVENFCSLFLFFFFLQTNQIMNSRCKKYSLHLPKDNV